MGSSKRLLWLGLIFSSIAGCSSDVTGLDKPEQALLWVTLNVQAATLATADGYKTMQLSATAYRGTGEVISDVVPTYAVSDNSLEVTPDGVVTALTATTDSYVIGRVTYNGVTRADTTWITVINTNTPALLDTFGISLNGQREAQMAAREIVSIDITAQGSDNQDLSPLIPIAFSTSDPSIATIDRDGTLFAYVPERSVTVYATTTVYGVTYTDSIHVAIQYPLGGKFDVVPRRLSTGEEILEFVPNIVTVGAGADVAFFNGRAGDIPNTKPIDVVFENPEAAQPSLNPFLPTGTGNISSILWTAENPFGIMQVRRFVEPGTYRFHSALYGSTGTLIVR